MPEKLEEQALATIGRDMYEAFSKGYTTKQWGMAPDKLPASVLKRLPVRFNYDDNYFYHQYQGIPVNGYTFLVKNMLDHPNIKVILNRKFIREEDTASFAYTFFTGPLDQWFHHDLGRLAYRTLTFEAIRKDGDFQGCALMQFPDPEVPYPVFLSISTLPHGKIIAKLSLSENIAAFAARVKTRIIRPGWQKKKSFISFMSSGLL